MNLLTVVISAIITIILGIYIATIITDSINEYALSENSEISPDMLKVLKLVSVFFSLFIFLTLALPMYSYLRRTGNFGNEIDKEEIKNKIKKAFMSPEEKLVHDIKPMYSFATATNTDDKSKDININPT